MNDNNNQSIMSDKKTINELVVIGEIEEMEDRISPGWLPNHDETLVEDDLDSIEEVEPRIAPGWMNHNETLVEDVQ
jgi:hypothetical protein